MVKIDRHKDATVYVVWVLWLIGMGERAVALVAGLGKKQVSGIIARSPYRNRSAMSDAERKAKLDELWSVRFEDGKPLDGGILDRVQGQFLELRRGQRKGAR